jgi:hypothetical protein
LYKSVAPAVVAVAVPVPPFVTGRVPLTAVVRPILPQLGAVDTPPLISALPVATAGSLLSVFAALAYKISPVVYVV